jgi:hypothetical protein
MHCEARGLKQRIAQDRSVSPLWGLNQQERATRTAPFDPGLTPPGYILAAALRLDRAAASAAWCLRLAAVRGVRPARVGGQTPIGTATIVDYTPLTRFVPGPVPTIPAHGSLPL